jgi:uncharacterized protein
MEYRRFGRTELQMSVFSCGGMRYQHKWEYLPMSENPDENQLNLEVTIRRSLEGSRVSSSSPTFFRACNC